MNTVRIKSHDGVPVEFLEGEPKQGGMKDVFFSPDGKQVVAFFRDRLDPAGRDRIAAIVGPYRERIFNQQGGDYWKDIFCWPSGIVEFQNRTGIVVPAYARHFFFEYGSKNGDFLHIKGKEKLGKWFTSASNRNKYLDPREKGTWLSYLRLCILMSRGVKRLHAAGLAHSDLSYNNVLVDPAGGHVSIIDIDGLVVPGKYPPDVVGTPDFIAPEVMATLHLSKNDPARKLPSIATDRHALAVLLYMYLLCRHPLRGSKVNDLDAMRDESLTMGERALFIEHPTDRSNRLRLDQVRPSDLPWADTAKLPYTITGPLLAPLFLEAFTSGLTDPSKRPSADTWERELVKTIDLVQPCANPTCELKWYVFDNTTKPVCPFCGTAYAGKLPVLNLYWSRKAGTWQPEGHRVMVYSGQSLFAWHSSRNVFPSERLTPEQRKRVGYFQFHQGSWYLVNEALPGLKELDSGGSQRPIPIGTHVELKDNQRLLLSPEEGGRLVSVQMAGG
ncbi:MAG: kinase [Candidatus Eremiobacteraeota bacterium]|nr:kinase [Candidatus Eremiobacteraeota bacterium]